MNKDEFLEKLREALKGLPKEDIDERISFYNEMILDKQEEGMSEEEAINEIGPIEKIVKQVVTDTSLVKFVKEKVKPKRKLSTLEIVLIILASPIWFALLIAIFSVLLSVVAIVFALIVAIWAIFIAICVSPILLLIPIFEACSNGNLFATTIILSGAITSIGLAILMFYASKFSTLGIIKLINKIVVKLKMSFTKKENN